MTPSEQSDLTERYLPHVHSIVQGMRRRLPPWVATEDLLHAGVVGSPGSPQVVRLAAR